MAETWLSFEGGTFVMSGIGLYHVDDDGSRELVTNRDRRDNILQNAVVIRSRSDSEEVAE